MSLGEAFVEIRADLRPFGRDLRRSVKPMVEAFERELNQAVGRAALAHSEDSGRKVGDRLARGIKNSLTNAINKDKNIFISIAAALGSALDDGISALPTEVKAAIVAGIILAIPIISALLTGAVVGAIGAGMALVGILAASQFQEVQDAAVSTGRELRVIFVSAAQDFGNEVVRLLGIVEARLHGMEGLLGDVFSLSAPFLEPLVQGTLQGIEAILDSLRDSLGNIKPFIDELGAGIAIVLDGIGTSIEILASSGREGSTALRDLASILRVIIVSLSIFLVIMTKIVGVFRDVIVAIERFTGGLSIPIILLAKFFNATDNAANRMQAFANTNTEFAGSIDGVIANTEAETRAIKELSDALEKASDAVKSQLDLNIDWEESLDNISESIKENGKTLDIRNEKGRANAREFADALRIAEEQTIQMLRRGEISSEQAVEQYSAQTEALRRMAVQAGIGEQEFNALFNEIILTGKLRISSEEMGIDSLAVELTGAGDAAQRLLEQLHLIRHLSQSIGGGARGGVTGFSDGGIQYTPTVANIAEDGAEAIIPLTKPARAAQILAETGLSSMLGGSQANTFMVFIGNEQLDSHVVRVVEGNNTKQALALSHGGRMF